MARVSAVSLQGRSGDPARALPLFADVLAYWLSLASWSHRLTTLRNLVPVLERAGASQAAAQLLGALRRPEHAPTYGAEQERLEQAAASLASHLSAGRFDELVTSGAGNDLPAAAVIVLESVHQLIAR